MVLKCRMRCSSEVATRCIRATCHLSPLPTVAFAYRREWREDFSRTPLSAHRSGSPSNANIGRVSPPGCFRRHRRNVEKCVSIWPRFRSGYSRKTFVLKYACDMNRSIINDKRSGPMQLNVEELQRYSRHLIMPEVTAEGQNRFKAGRVLCIGGGGLGSPAALYLAAAGVGTI